MAGHSKDPLLQLSAALASATASAQSLIVAIRAPRSPPLSGTLWRDNLVVEPYVVEGKKMTSFEVPTLTTDRLRLRAFRAGDLDAFAAMRANPEVIRYLGTGRTSTPVEVWRMMVAFLG